MFHVAAVKIKVTSAIASARDDAVPRLAHKRGALAATSLSRREAKKDLLNEVVRQVGQCSSMAARVGGNTTTISDEAVVLWQNLQGLVVGACESSTMETSLQLGGAAAAEAVHHHHLWRCYIVACGAIYQIRCCCHRAAACESAACFTIQLVVITVMVLLLEPETAEEG